MPDIEAIFAELDKYNDPVEEWQEGDVDVEMYAKRYNVSASRARQKMDEIAA